MYTWCKKVLVFSITFNNFTQLFIIILSSQVIHNVCPECAIDASSNAGSSRSRNSSSRRSSSGTTGHRYYDDSGTDAASSLKSSDRLSAGSSSRRSSSSRKVKIRVKSMRYKDVNGKEGRYSGDVNEGHQPHGQGKIKYKDGTAFNGVWSEGVQVHGKRYRAKSSSSKSSGGSSSKRKEEWSSGKQREAAEGGGKRTVRKMKWLDYYGDPGLYSGEIDATGMPDGTGSMKYDHGLIQEGHWRKGQFLEEDDDDDGGMATSSSRRRDP